MRKEFSKTIEKIATENKKVIFLTGDLGFMALENVRSAIKDRFINTGVSEQNMISMAAGLASQGLTPICYSIAPFAVFRPAEQIRVDVCLHNMNVKIVGNGGGYGYGIMGGTHHALEDLAVLSSFPNMKCYVPLCNEDTEGATKAMMERRGPSYLRLGLGAKPTWLTLPPYVQTRKLTSGNKITVAVIGPVVLNILQSLEKDPELKKAVELFVISEMPIPNITPALQNSLKKTKRLLVVEEHVSRGGLAENLSLLLMKQGVACRLASLCAQGYPNGLYGSQAYHQKISKLDPESIAKMIKKMI